LSRLLIWVVWLAVSTAGCYLALVVSYLVTLGGGPALLALVSDVEVAGFRPHWALPQIRTRFPNDGSALLWAFHRSGLVAAGAVAVLLAAVAQRRWGGWLRVWFSQVILWSAAFYGLLVSGLWGTPGPWRPTALWLLGALVVLPAIYFSLRRLDGAALLGWVAAPLAVWGVTLSVATIRFRGAAALAMMFGPAALALAIGLPATWRAKSAAAPVRLDWRGAAALLAVSAAALGGLLQYDRLVRWLRPQRLAALETRHWRLLVEGDTARGAAAQADRRLETVAARLGIPLDGRKLAASLYGSTAAKTALAGADAAFTLEAGGARVHHLLSPEGGLTDPRGDALALLHMAWGRPGAETMARAIARYAVGEFWGRPLGRYAARIHHEEGPNSLAEIFGLHGEYLSPLTRDALAGAWVEKQVGRHGVGILPVLYRQGQPAWSEADLEGAPEAAEEPPRRRAVSGFFRGISFSHEVGGEYGYGSDRAAAELRRIRDLGADSVSIVPYVFTRAPRDTRIQFSTDERDDRVIRAIRQARRLGLRVLLKPALWGGGFTGDIRFSNDADFEQWFGRYRRWLLHQARLAELEGVELLSIGNELGGLTGRAAPWRALIDDLRRIYSGPLTYAASWGPEFERLAFWDALDYLGVNLYYPLAGQGELPQPDSALVRDLEAKLAEAARRHGKRILFTEVGYPALASAATRPWDSAGRTLDIELQRRCYETVFRAFYGRPWLAGLYWWKWPSHGEGHRFDTSFSPVGKPALAVISQWYTGGIP